MPDWTHSTHLPIPQAQEALVGIVADLRQLDGRLHALIEKITPESDKLLPAELRAGAECIRTDLLSDAISTLSALAVLTEADALQRRVEVATAVEQIAVFG